MTALATLDTPLRTFFERLEPLAGESQPDMGRVAALLVELARDGEYFAHHIAATPANGALPLHMPRTGPCLQMVHRPEGVMGAVHSHSVWVGIAPVAGTETHRRYDVLARKTGGRAKLQLAEERRLEAHSGDSTTLTPPDDVHQHGHVSGCGEAAYVLILTGEQQVKFERQEYDLKAGTWRTLAPGDRGRWVE